MRFKEWLLMEGPWIWLKEPITIHGCTFNGLDVRLEDYPKGSNPERSGTSPQARHSPSFYWDSFSAPLWDGQYLNFTVTPGQSGAKVKVDHQYYRNTLPEDWYLYATFFNGNQQVVPPEWPEKSSGYDLWNRPDLLTRHPEPAPIADPIFTQ